LKGFTPTVPAPITDLVYKFSIVLCVRLKGPAKVGLFVFTHLPFVEPCSYVAV
jgi:hypothetical protein